MKRESELLAVRESPEKDPISNPAPSEITREYQWDLFEAVMFLFCGTKKVSTPALLFECPALGTFVLAPGVAGARSTFMIHKEGLQQRGIQNTGL